MSRFDDVAQAGNSANEVIRLDRFAVELDKAKKLKDIEIEIRSEGPPIKLHFNGTENANVDDLRPELYALVAKIRGFLVADVALWIEGAFAPPEGMVQEVGAVREEKPPICELCYSPLPEHPAEADKWDFVFQSWICPDCTDKRGETPASACVGGCFAEGKPDPRAKV